MSLPAIALTCGDPAGVGPELCCRVATDPAIREHCQPVVIGDPDLLQRICDSLDMTMPDAIDAVRVPGFSAAAVVPGRIDAANGRLAGAAIEQAIAGCLSKRYSAMVTAPLCKAATQAAGLAFPGHTEMLAERCGRPQVAMMMYDPGIAVVMSTCHQALIGVSAALTSDRIVFCASALATALTRLRNCRHPRLAMLGFNPHAGEGGLFGDEEQRIIAPAVAALRAQGLDISDPLPPDTAFTPAAREHYHGHVCHYHDQALIPFKALAFDDGVNITLGLPIIRTSVDHGTAFNLAWRGIASDRSLRAAIAAAVHLVSTGPDQDCR